MSSHTLLDAWLIEHSPKRLLQAALCNALQNVVTGWPKSLDFATLSLSDLQVTVAGHWQYESAIAQQLAARLPADTRMLGPQLAAEITAWSAPAAPVTIATGLKATVNSAGRLTFTLSSEGRQAWLQHWLQSPWPEMLLVPETPPAHSESCAGEWPLCDRLQLSLPMLLQWADVRCQRWQADWSPNTKPPVIVIPETAPQRVDVMLTFLLPTVMRGLDQLANDSSAAKTGKRVGYCLAVRVYELEARLAGWRSPRAGEPATVSRWAALMATQKALQLILAMTFRQGPCRSL